MQDSVKKETIDVSHIPASTIEQMKEQGWELEEGGKTMTRSIKTGLEEEASTMGNSWSSSAEPALFDAVDDTADTMTEKGQTTGEYYMQGVATGITNAKETAEKAASYAMLDVDEAARNAAEEKSPSKKGVRVGEYYSMGISVGIKNLASMVKDSATEVVNDTCNAAASMMASISSIVQDDSINWTPTITPVVDASQLQNGSQMLENTFGDSALNMAASTSLSVNSSSQAALAAQVQSLSEQVKKLADTDYSKILEGVAINVDASTNVDGTPLKRMASKFTIQQIDDQTKTYNMALGGRA
jgi:hypothetical protein